MKIFKKILGIQWSCLIPAHTPDYFAIVDHPRICPVCHAGLLPKVLVDVLVSGKLHYTTKPNRRENLLLTMVMFYIAWAQHNQLSNPLTFEAESTEGISSRDSYFDQTDFAGYWPAMMLSWNYMGNEEVGNVLGKDQLRFAALAVGGNYLDWEVVNEEETTIRIFPRPYLSALNPRNFESFERLYTDLVKVTKPLQIVSSLMPKFLGVIRENLDKIPTFRPVQIKSRTEIVIRGADSNPKLIARLRTLQPSKFDPVESSYFFRCFPKPSSVNRLLGPFGSVHSIEFDEDRELLTLYATSEYFLDSQAQDIQAVPYEEIKIRVNLESLPAGAEHPFEVDGLHDLPWWWTKFEVYSDSLLKGASPWRT